MRLRSIFASSWAHGPTLPTHKRTRRPAVPIPSAACLSIYRTFATRHPSARAARPPLSLTGHGSLQQDNTSYGLGGRHMARSHVTPTHRYALFAAVSCRLSPFPAAMAPATYDAMPNAHSPVPFGLDIEPDTFYRFFFPEIDKV